MTYKIYNNLILKKIKVISCFNGFRRRGNNRLTFNRRKGPTEMNTSWKGQKFDNLAKRCTTFGVRGMDKLDRISENTKLYLGTNSKEKRESGKR